MLAIDSYLPAGLLRDISDMVSLYRGTPFVRVRVVRLSAIIFAEIIDKACKDVYMPFCPTICGVPVEPWEQDHCGVFAVADDDTPLSVSHSGKVQEKLVWQP